MTSVKLTKAIMDDFTTHFVPGHLIHLEKEGTLEP